MQNNLVTLKADKNGNFNLSRKVIRIKGQLLL